MKRISLFGLIMLVLLISTVSAARIITDLTAPPIETSYIIRVGMSS